MSFRLLFGVIRGAKDVPAAIDLQAPIEFKLMEILSSNRGQKWRDQRGGRNTMAANTSDAA